MRLYKFNHVTYSIPIFAEKEIVTLFESFSERFKIAIPIWELDTNRLHIVQIFLFESFEIAINLETQYKFTSHCSNPSPSALKLPSPPGNYKSPSHRLNPSPSGSKLPSTSELVPNCRHIVRIFLRGLWNCHPHLGTCYKLPSHRSNPSLESF